MVVGGGLLLLLVWLALTQSVQPSFVAAGACCCIGVLVAWRAVFPPVRSSSHPILRHPVALVRFGITLARRFAISTLRTAWLIVRGQEAGRLVAVPLRIADSTGRFLLLTSITLTPSTISLLIEGDLLYIHWLQRADGRADWREIKESLEQRLQAVFDQEVRDAGP